MKFRQRITVRTQCAGAACPEREGCQRYEARSQDSPWASFDVERRQHPEPCIHRIKVVTNAR